MRVQRFPLEFEATRRTMANSATQVFWHSVREAGRCTRLGGEGGPPPLGRPEAGGCPTPDPHPHLEAYLSRGKGYQ